MMPDVSNQQSQRLPMDVYKQTPLQSCTFDEDLWSKPKEPLWSHAHYVPVCDYERCLVWCSGCRMDREKSVRDIQVHHFTPPFSPLPSGNYVINKGGNQVNSINKR